MKKIIALILTLTLLLALTACGASGSTTSTAETTQAATAADGKGTSIAADGSVITNYDKATVQTDKELPKFRILVLYNSFTDKLGSQYKSSMEYIAEPLNIDFTFLETGSSGDEAMAAIEAALVSGYDGCIGTVASEARAALFDKAGVPYVVCGGMPSDETQAKAMASYENYLGSVVVDDYAAGYAMAEALYADGCRNVMWDGLSRGYSGQHDARAAGFADGFASHDDMKLIVENWDYTQWADGIATAAATYPELDGVGCTCLMANIYNTIESEGLVGQVQLAGIDVSEGTGRAFENGSLSYIAGGNYACEQICFAVLYNYLLDGTRVIADPTVNLTLNNINLSSLEDYNNYIKYLDSAVPAYTAQEILDMTHYVDESFNAEKMTELCKAYSLEDVIARHADLVQ